MWLSLDTSCLELKFIDRENTMNICIVYKCDNGWQDTDWLALTSKQYYKTKLAPALHSDCCDISQLPDLNHTAPTL